MFFIHTNRFNDDSIYRNNAIIVDFVCSVLFFSRSTSSSSFHFIFNLHTSISSNTNFFCNNLNAHCISCTICYLFVLVRIDRYTSFISIWQIVWAKSHTSYPYKVHNSIKYLCVVQYTYVKIHHVDVCDMRKELDVILSLLVMVLLMLKMMVLSSWRYKYNNTSILKNRKLNGFQIISSLKFQHEMERDCITLYRCESQSEENWSEMNEALKSSVLLL